ncbi:MAG: SGNH/GDSL hydrolase family protein [Clostridiales bacterium]|jgi:lysophospholipase L1-like esterase|nr:SGNH/GDSL hydrolase family protein [Clostridiales bacterium]
MLKDIFHGKTVLFQGDSVTDCGRLREDDASLGYGYPEKISSAYMGFFPESTVRFINRGVSGDRSCNLLERYQEDFLNQRYDVISILIGINDVWRAYDSGDPTPPEIFEKNYSELLERIKRDLPDAYIIMIEPFVLHSLPDRLKWREDLDPKIQVVRKLAVQYAGVFLPMDGILAGYIASGVPQERIADDGVHPTPAGHGIIAYEWLKAVCAL